MKSTRRDRVIIFRVSADEYQVLLNACARGGARSMSDFARKELFAHLNSPAAVSADARGCVDELVNHLKLSICALVEEMEALRKRCEPGSLR